MNIENEFKKRDIFLKLFKKKTFNIAQFQNLK